MAITVFFKKPNLQYNSKPLLLFLASNKEKTSRLISKMPSQVLILLKNLNMKLQSGSCVSVPLFQQPFFKMLSTSSDDIHNMAILLLHLLVPPSFTQQFATVIFKFHFKVSIRITKTMLTVMIFLF